MIALALAAIIVLDCAGLTGHNFGPCPDDRRGRTEIQAPGDAGSSSNGDASSGGSGGSGGSDSGGHGGHH